MDRLLAAIWFAIEKHGDQKRRGEKTPYITHPLGVSVLLSKVTQDEDIHVAGILHDCLEDTSATKEEIEKLFGKRVAQIVSECSQEDMTKPWKERKETQLERIEKISRDAALVKSADFLYNIDNLLRGLKTNGMEFFKLFHASAEDKLNYDLKKLERLKEFHPNPLLDELDIYMDEILAIAKPALKNQD